MKDDLNNKKNNPKEEDKEEESFEDISFEENTEEGEPMLTKDVAKKLREEIKTLRKEKEEYLTGWQRARADYANLQKDFDLARINISILTKEKMTESLLPALDSFEMAFNNKEHWDTLDKEWRAGIESIYSQLITGLRNAGIEKIQEVNVAFNPNIHESISTVETSEIEKDHTVEKILQVGYKIGDLSADKVGRVIRPAKVTIFEYK